MKIWLIVIRGDDYTWVENAWDDESTAGNEAGWKAAVDKARQTAAENDYELRIIPVEIPGVHESFDTKPLRGAVLTNQREDER